LHLAEECERATRSADLESTKVGMLASAAVWRRLAADFTPSEVARSNTAKYNGRLTRRFGFRLLAVSGVF
jgi:hypothetical protein